MGKYTYVVIFHAMNRYREEDYTEIYEICKTKEEASASARIFKNQRPWLNGHFSIDRVPFPYDEAMEDYDMLRYLWANDLNTITVGRV